jgi:hypothetical protein
VKKHTLEKNVKFPAYSGDFFPYADNDDSYWTGYYTTRPALKRRIRETGAMLRSAEILYSLSADTNNFEEEEMRKLVEARRHLALVQHHDGVTGTSKQYVADDYMSKLGAAIETSEKTMDKAVRKMMKNPNLKLIVDWTEELSIEAGKDYQLLLFNSLSFYRSEIVHIRVTSPLVAVFTSGGARVPVQVSPSTPFPPFTLLLLFRFG